MSSYLVIATVRERTSQGVFDKINFYVETQGEADTEAIKNEWFRKNGDRYELNSFDAIKPYRTWEQCLLRYPRIAYLLQHRMIASPGEAGCCIRDCRNGLRYGGECVSHSGMSPADQIKLALKFRHTTFKLYPLTRAQLLEKYDYRTPATATS